MKKIWKFPIPPGFAIHTVRLPVGAEILSAQFQGKDLCLWAIVYPDAKIIHRFILVAPTGDVLPEATLEFIDTVQIGPVVLHIFEIK